MSAEGENREALERLRSERERAETSRREDDARRRRGQILRTTSIGAGMCLLVGLLLGARLLLLVPFAVLLGGGSAWLALLFNLGTMTSGFALGLGATLGVALSGGHPVLAPVFCIPLAFAIFLGHKGETEL